MHRKPLQLDAEKDTELDAEKDTELDAEIFLSLK